VKRKDVEDVLAIQKERKLIMIQEWMNWEGRCDSQKVGDLIGLGGVGTFVCERFGVLFNGRKWSDGLWFRNPIRNNNILTCLQMGMCFLNAFWTELIMIQERLTVWEATIKSCGHFCSWQIIIREFWSLAIKTGILSQSRLRNQLLLSFPFLFENGEGSRCLLECGESWSPLDRERQSEYTTLVLENGVQLVFRVRTIVSLVGENWLEDELNGIILTIEL
jgi:hypothetical protein